MGCLTNATCAKGKTCDLSSGALDGMHRKVGTCRSPDPTTVCGAMPATCPMIAGVYRFVYDGAASTPGLCDASFQNSTVTFVQDAMCGADVSSTPQITIAGPGTVEVDGIL